MRKFLPIRTNSETIALQNHAAMQTHKAMILRKYTVTQPCWMAKLVRMLGHPKVLQASASTNPPRAALLQKYAVAHPL